MKFPETNKIHKDPVPKFIESNAKQLEQHLKAVNWHVFAKAYLYIISLLLLTVFSFILVTGVAKWLVSLL